MQDKKQKRCKKMYFFNKPQVSTNFAKITCYNKNGKNKETVKKQKGLGQSD